MLRINLPARALALLAFALVVACKSSTNPPLPDAGPVTTTCSSDAECSTGFMCDRASRQCYCTGDAACPSGLYCNAFTGMCVASVPGCTSNTACGAGMYCDAALRTCEPLTPLCGKCHTDAECGTSSYCSTNPTYPSAGTFCSPACATQSDASSGCPGGLVCEARDATVNAQLLCFPASGACGVSNACVPDSLALCTTAADCNDSTQACDATAGNCVAKNRVCPAGDACDPQQRICAHVCSTDADCTQIEGTRGYECRNNACYALTTCTSNNDCAVKKVCAPNPDGSKSCVAGCVSASDCPIGQGCNNDPSHPGCTAGCQVNSDCPLNQICSGGACASTASGCAQVCQTTAVCPIGASCSSSDCCVSGSFAQLCANNKCTENLSTGCLVMYGHGCAMTADCADLPNTLCKAVAGSGNYCAADLQLHACGSAADCPFKGFSCTSFGTTSFCTPNGAAVSACFVGRL